MFNSVTFVGHLTRDVELRYLSNNTALGNTAIASNRKYSTSNGQKAEEVCFIDITLWGRMAEIANQYLKKGNLVLVRGRIKFDQWDDQATGQKRSKHSIVVEELKMLGSSQNNNQTTTYHPQGQYSTNSYQQQGNINQHSKTAINKHQQQNAPQSKNEQDFSEYNEVPDIDVDSFADENGELPF